MVADPREANAQDVARGSHGPTHLIMNEQDLGLQAHVGQDATQHSLAVGLSALGRIHHCCCQANVMQNRVSVQHFQQRDTTNPDSHLAHTCQTCIRNGVTMGQINDGRHVLQHQCHGATGLPSNRSYQSTDILVSQGSNESSIHQINGGTTESYSNSMRLDYASQDDAEYFSDSDVTVEDPPTCASVSIDDRATRIQDQTVKAERIAVEEQAFYGDDFLGADATTNGERSIFTSVEGNEHSNESDNMSPETKVQIGRELLCRHRDRTGHKNHVGRSDLGGTSTRDLKAPSGLEYSHISDYGQDRFDTQHSPISVVDRDDAGQILEARNPAADTGHHDTAPNTEFLEPDYMEVDYLETKHLGTTSDLESDPLEAITLETYPLGCTVCHVEYGKFKCPKCLMRYCQLKCFRRHTLKICRAATAQLSPKVRSATSALVAPVANVMDISTAPLDSSPLDSANVFSILSHSEALRRLFAKYPNLPMLLNCIGEAGELPSYVLLPTTDGAWDDDVGNELSLRALQTLRRSRAVDGSAIREYCSIVIAMTKQMTAAQGADHIYVKREVSQQEDH